MTQSSLIEGFREVRADLVYLSNARNPNNIRVLANELPNNYVTIEFLGSRIADGFERLYLIRIRAVAGVTIAGYECILLHSSVLENERIANYGFDKDPLQALSKCGMLT